MQISPSIQAVSILLNARQSVSYLGGAREILSSAIWGIIWDLSGEELHTSLFLVSLDHARTYARWAN